MSAPERFTLRQLGIVLLIAAVQLVNILDFVMVMPLGPDFAKTLHFSEAHIGYVGGSYTAAACVAGLVAAGFLDRFDRRKALFVAMLGLVTGTALGGMATSFETLIAARLLAGAFGGPATALSIAIVSDSVSPALRGRALGIVMGAFSIASVFGVPAGLLLANEYGPRAPFFCVAGLGLLVTLLAMAMLPPMRGHLDRPVQHPVGTAELLSRPLVQVTYVMVAVTMMAGFVLIPNISGYLQLNLGFPRAGLGTLYLYGGVASFFTMLVAGWLVDRLGSFKVSVMGTALVVGTIATGFWLYPPLITPVATFVLFMTGMGLRNVAYSTLNTKVPEPEVRARFQSLSSAVQHGASAIAAVLSAQLLTLEPAVGNRFVLAGMPRVAGLAIALTLLIPLFLWWIEAQVLKRETGRPLIPKAAVR